MPPDPEEPRKLAEAVGKLGLKHVVITSVDRDDLEDYGASHFAKTIYEIRHTTNDISIEVLVPDFQGSIEAIDLVIEAKPDVLNHNIETVPRLHPLVKPKSNYKRSLGILERPRSMAPDIYTKSGLMVGFGETKDEVLSVMKDLRAVDCDIMTIGQYLKPPGSPLEVKDYITPELFKWYRNKAEEMGFLYVASAPLVRSSYNATESMLKLRKTVTQ